MIKNRNKQLLLKLPDMVMLSLLLLFPSVSYSQALPEKTGLLEKSFRSWIAKTSRDEIYLHTDRTDYVAGERIWFSAYLSDRNTGKRSLSGGIAGIELISPFSKPVLQKRILIENGRGTGDFLLPDTLRPGSYWIRSSTETMKQNNQGNCFMQKIRVYNSLDKRPFVESEPDESSTYEATVTAKDLPGNLKYEITADGLDSDTINLQLKGSESEAGPSDKIVLIVSGSEISYTGTWTPETAVFSIKSSLLRPGINVIFIFNDNLKVIAEKSLYSRVGEGEQLTINVDENFSRRARAEFEIKLPDTSTDSGNKSTLSVSVLPAETVSNQISIADYHVFGSDYGPFLPLKFSGKRLAEMSVSSIDSILSDQRNRRYNWDEILSGKPLIEQKTTENGYVLSGKLVTSANTSPGEGEKILMSLPSKIAQFDYALTDKQGNFSFILPVSDKTMDIILMPENYSSGYRINTGAETGNNYFHTKQKTLSPERLPDHMRNLSFNSQIMRNYGIDAMDVNTAGSVEGPPALRFYGKPDFTLSLDKFIRLPTMEETFFELLPKVRLKKDDDVWSVTISDRVDNNPVILKPTLMIDGVVINDASLISDLDPDSVERIDVLRTNYLVGTHHFTGIVNVITNSGDFRSVALPGYMVRFPFRVTDPPSVFHAPGYTAQPEMERKIPDTRNTLAWFPSVTTDNKGSYRSVFTTGDVPGEYLIVIEGFNGGGRPFSFSKQITVK